MFFLDITDVDGIRGLFRPDDLRVISPNPQDGTTNLGFTVGAQGVDMYVALTVEEVIQRLRDTRLHVEVEALDRSTKP